MMGLVVEMWTQTTNVLSDGLQSVTQESEAKMELWSMALPPFLCLCMEQAADTQSFLCWKGGIGNVSKDSAPVSAKLCQELKCWRIFQVFIQSCQKTCCKQEFNIIEVLG